MEPPRDNDVREGFGWTRCKDAFLHFHLNCDRIFYWIGFSIGKRPWAWLLATLVMCCLCIPGMIFWREELDDVKLFMPVDSIVRKDAEWVKEHFKEELRYENIIVTAPNVLEPEVLRAIQDLENSIKDIVVDDNTWKDVCAGFLTWFEDENLTNPEDIEFTKEILKSLDSTMMKHGCIYQSLLTLWQDKQSRNIYNMTKQEILYDITAELRDKTSKNILMDISPLLSEVTYDKNGIVSGAKATILNWMLKRTHPRAPDWEAEFIKQVLHSNRTLPKGMEVYALASRSFKDFIAQIVDNNVMVLFCGLSLIAVYVVTMIGKCNAIEQRIYLSLMGVSVVGQATLSSYGLCYYMGYFYGPIHPVLPFLLLGIGVDDMFVIMQSLENLAEHEKALDIPTRIAKALQQSGMSVTVTSLTNIVAFGIGVTTVMPFLRSFCMFAMMGLFFLYIFEITFFVSCLVYDERRLDAKKEGCCCRPVPNWKPNKCSRKSFQQLIFKKYIGPNVVKIPVKIIVLMTTACLLAINIWAIFQLKQDFDPLMYINEESYPIQFNNKLKQYFPKLGKRAGIYMYGIDYYKDREMLLGFADELNKNPYINNHTLDPWFVAYEKWLKDNEYVEIESRDEYYNILTEYLFLTREGQAHIKDIKFDRLPSVEYNITTSKIPIQHILLNTTVNQIHAIQSIRQSIAAANFSTENTHIAIYSQDYISWMANKIIGEELIRNLGLEILAIAAVTLLTLRNLQASFWVICCVVFTLIDLLGTMYFLNLTIEISTTIMILLCAGLAVDYAAHVGLEFTRTLGTKNERAISTLAIIGVPVFNGGFSTFLAFILLGFSRTYLFTTFFKLFTTVVIFGLFHALLFLPVILSLLGPSERRISATKNDHTVHDQTKYFTVNLSHNGKDVTARFTK